LHEEDNARAKEAGAMDDVSAIPKGYHSVTPYLIIDGAAQAIQFYREAFGASEVFRLPMGDKLAHGEIRIGDSHIMLSDEWPDMDLLGPRRRGGATASLMIYLPDVDIAFDRAVRAGATVERPVEDQFWGDRMGTVLDPFGHRWTLATHIREVSPDEMQRHMEAMAAEAV